MISLVCIFFYFPLLSLELSSSVRIHLYDWHIFEGMGCLACACWCHLNVSSRPPPPFFPLTSPLLPCFIYSLPLSFPYLRCCFFHRFPSLFSFICLTFIYIFLHFLPFHLPNPLFPSLPSLSSFFHFPFPSLLSPPSPSLLSPPFQFLLSLPPAFLSLLSLFSLPSLPFVLIPLPSLPLSLLFSLPPFPPLPSLPPSF